MQVLIIDDNTEITDMLSFYLENDGHECKVVNEGQQGLQALQFDNFDLALLDLAMPDFSGMDIIKSLKKDDMIGKKKIVVLTASTLNGEETDALLRDGIKAVLKKPISIEELTSAIEQFRQ